MSEDAGPQDPAADGPSDRLVIRSGTAELGRVYPWFAEVAARLGLSDAVAFAIHVALEEAVSNAARHGFEPGAAQPITIRAEAGTAQVVITIEDAGRPFDPLQAPPPAPFATLDAVQAGGLGIQLIRRFASAMAYARDGRLNRLTLRFDRPPAA